jgi:hypothetical protein
MMEAELLPGFLLWNAGEYLLAQEEFEHLWLAEVGARRQCLRGLIHAAMGFHYVIVRDISSAQSKLSSATTILASLAADSLGLELDGLRAGIAVVRARLDGAEGDWSVDPKGVPFPCLVPAAAAAPHERQP